MKNSSCKVPSKRTKSNISQGKTLKDYFTREVKGRVLSTVNSTAQATEQSAVYSDYDSASQAVLCPICQMNLTVYRIEERTAHVNNCLGDHLIDGMANDLGTRQNITSTSIVNEGSKVVESKKDFINVDYNTTRGAGDQKDFAITEDLTINEPVTRKDFIIKDSNAASTWAKENKKDFAITQNITEKIDVEQRHEVWTFDNDSNLKRTFDSVSSTDELELRSDSRKDSKKASLSFMSSQLEMYNDCKQDPEKASLSSMNNHLQVRKPFEHTSNLRSKDNNLSITPETKRTARTAPFIK